MLSQFCTLGVDYIKVGSRAFFMDIVLSNYAKHWRTDFQPYKASQNLGGLQGAQLPSFKKATPDLIFIFCILL